MMKTRLQSYEDGMVATRRNGTKDPRSNPKLHGGVWKPWVELEKTSSSNCIVFILHPIFVFLSSITLFLKNFDVC